MTVTSELRAAHKAERTSKLMMMMFITVMAKDPVGALSDEMMRAQEENVH